MSSPRREESIIEPGGPSLQGPHRVGAFANCPQLEAYAHELHLRPALEKPATFIGTLVHHALAYRYGALMKNKLSWLVYRDGYEIIQRAGAHRPDLMAKATDIYRAYEQHYQNDPWRPIAVEHQFVVYFGDEPYSCRTDLLALEGNDVVLVDHKTHASLSNTIPFKYGCDPQMLTGLALVRMHGFDVKRVVINAITKEDTPRFQRYNVPINPHLYDQFFRDVGYWVTQMKITRDAFPDPRKRPRNLNACFGRFGACDYLPLCNGTGTEHEYTLPADRLKR